MAEMLTLFGRELSELNYEQLERELIVQKHLRLCVNRGRCDILRYREHSKTGIITQVNQDKEDFDNIVINHLDAFIAEIEYQKMHRFAPTRKGVKRRIANKRRNEAAHKEMCNEIHRSARFEKTLAQDPLMIAWDKEKFELIAKDRGYQTKEYLIYKVGQELKLDRRKTGILLNTGRFTWGQILCLGAMFEMTPKEFCDTFLAGYFRNTYGEYRADYEGLCRDELLKRAVRPTPPMEEVVVGADGRPLDEEEWFDDE